MEGLRPETCPSFILCPRQLFVRQPLHGYSHFPTRRFLPFRKRPEMGNLPLSRSCMEDRPGAVHGRGFRSQRSQVKGVIRQDRTAGRNRELRIPACLLPFRSGQLIIYHGRIRQLRTLLSAGSLCLRSDMGEDILMERRLRLRIL